VLINSLHHRSPQLLHDDPAQQGEDPNGRHGLSTIAETLLLETRQEGSESEGLPGKDCEEIEG
jgi:hypothetical protein